MGCIPLHCTDATFLDKNIKIAVAYVSQTEEEKKPCQLFDDPSRATFQILYSSLDSEQYFSYNWLLGQHLG